MNRKRKLQESEIMEELFADSDSDAHVTDDSDSSEEEDGSIDQDLAQTQAQEWVQKSRSYVFQHPFIQHP